MDIALSGGPFDHATLDQFKEMTKVDSEGPQLYAALKSDDGWTYWYRLIPKNEETGDTGTQAVFTSRSK